MSKPLRLVGAFPAPRRGAHAPSRVVASAPAGNIGRAERGFDEGVEPDWPCLDLVDKRWVIV